jgi:biopolymer transport protein ExbD
MRRGKGRRHSEELGEPEILPMMNVLFMLVMVLMGMSSFLPLGVISTHAPRLANSGAIATGKRGLDLKVMLLKTGINISVQGALLKGEDDPFLPKISYGDRFVYDFAGLQEELTQLKKQYPDETSLMFMVDPDALYDDVVHAMDASRESVKGEVLFPDVAFIPGVIR